MKAVIDFLKQHDKFAVLTHLNPDGDALGSAYALVKMLNNLGKSAEVILLCEPPEKYRFDEFEPLYCLVADIKPETYDAAIAVDCATVGRLSDAQSLFLNLPNCNVDHHASNTGYAKINYIKNVAATGELIWEIGEQLKVPTDETIRMAIYMALATDTGRFTYSNTEETALRIFAEIVAEGLPLADMAAQIFNKRSLGATKLIARFIENIRFYEGGQLAVSTIHLEDIKECGAEISDSEILIDYAREIEDVEIAAFIRELKEDTYKVSLRANTYANVGALAGEFGGGGHEKAAGCMIRGNIYDITEKLIKSARNYLK